MNQPADNVVVRFAPSPTGYLHLGSARTGLYNYIFARRHGGTFILRIEDTDLTRSTDEAIAQIISAMREMGLDWDEGPGVPGAHGPYRQTERQAIYHEYVGRLLAEGHAYPCFCTAEELDEERRLARAEKRDWVYSGKCRALSPDDVERRKAAGDPFTLRIRVPAGTTTFHDLLRGPVEFANDTIGDFIILRSDGTVTYNLAVVVDDATMEVTHVLRGDDHISNTPKQVVIYEALGAAVPEFLHMPLLFGTDKKKLSKRHGATKLEQLVDMGYLVEVVRNYLCFLSAEFDESMITWTLDDLVEKFDVLRLGTSASIFDPDKLRWMNGRYIRQLSDADLGERLLRYLERIRFFGDCGSLIEAAATGPAALVELVEAGAAEVETASAPSAEQAALVRTVAPFVREKIEVLADFLPIAGWFFRPLGFSDDAAARLAATPGAAETLCAAAAGIAALEPWDIEHIEALVRELPQRLELKPKVVFAALRLGMSGQRVTPGLFESLWALGREEAAGRLTAAAALL